MKKVIIASTYLHLIDSLILNNQFDDEFYLVYINSNNQFFDEIKTIFSKSLFLKEDKRDKFKNRINNYNTLFEFIQKIDPAEIIVGNDRKIEISILIANYRGNYSYVDDGLHSYIPEQQHLFKYTFIEKIIKQILYKNPLVLPKFIGTGEYIKKCYLFKPEFANKYLKQKELIKLQPNIEYLQNIFKSFVSKELIYELSMASKIIFLPHPKFINNDILDKILPLIDENTFIKLHPRDNKTKIDAKILPNIASEFLFPFINVEVYGFKTTAILTIKWLRDDLDVYYFGKEDKFMEKNGIKRV